MIRTGITCRINKVQLVLRVPNWSGVTDKTQREDRKISDKIRCIINLHRTQIKKEIKDRNMREIKPFLPLKHSPSVFLMET